MSGKVSLTGRHAVFRRLAACDHFLHVSRSYPKLFDTAPGDDREARRRTHRTSRLIAKLRGHRLITKIGKSRLYRVTARGIKAMWPAIRFRKNDFPIDFQRLASAGC